MEPWTNEPDAARWDASGLPCRVVRDHGGDTYKTMAFVQGECVSLAAQAVIAAIRSLSHKPEKEI